MFFPFQVVAPYLPIPVAISPAVQAPGRSKCTNRSAVTRSNDPGTVHRGRQTAAWQPQRPVGTPSDRVERSGFEASDFLYQTSFLYLPISLSFSLLHSPCCLLFSQLPPSLSHSPAACVATTQPCCLISRCLSSSPTFLPIPPSLSPLSCHADSIRCVCPVRNH